MAESKSIWLHLEQLEQLCRTSDLTGVYELMSAHGVQILTLLLSAKAQPVEHWRMRELKLGRCGFLTCLPESIGQLTALRELELDHCESLTCLPEPLGRLPALEKLTFGCCYRLTCLPESLGQLAALQTLSVQYCRALTCMPESLGQLAALKALNLSCCTALTCMPESLGQLAALKVLNLRCCTALTCLPGSLGQLAALQVLDLRNSNCEAIPGHVEHARGSVHLTALNGEKRTLQNFNHTMLTLVLATRRGKRLWLPSEVLALVLTEAAA